MSRGRSLHVVESRWSRGLTFLCDRDVAPGKPCIASMAEWGTGNKRAWVTCGGGDGFGGRRWTRKDSGNERETHNRTDQTQFLPLGKVVLSSHYKRTRAWIDLRREPWQTDEDGRTWQSSNQAMYQWLRIIRVRHFENNALWSFSFFCLFF